MRSILITGGTGSFGQAFAKKLLTLNWQAYGAMSKPDRIIIYSRGEHKQFQMSETLEDPDGRMRYFIGDVRDKDRLTMAMKGVDIVIHSAALKRIEVGFYNPIEMKKTNVDGACNVIEAAMNAGVGKVVALSTDKAYQPVSAYGHSKAMAETLFLGANRMTGEYPPHFSVTRYGNVWRSAGSVVPKWEEILDNAAARVVPVTDPGCTRFFMTMDQAIDLVMKAIGEKGGILHIPTLPAYRLGDLAKAMAAEMKITGLPEYEKKHEGMCDGNTSDIARRMSVQELVVQVLRPLTL